MNQDDFTSVLKLLPPLRISCGHVFTIAASDSGELYGWGDGKNGRLGVDEVFGNVWEPIRIELPDINGLVN
jgi:alpha-tubulin suppressor-like RCC1 family protein